MQAGEYTFLRWEVTEGFGVTVDARPVEKIGQMEVCPQENHAYILGADMGTHVETRQVQITVSSSAQIATPEEQGPSIPAYQAEAWMALGGPPVTAENHARLRIPQAR